jgi:hypothetical protein
MIRLITAVPVNGTEADADRQMIDVAARLAPNLSRFIPN